MFLKTNKPGTNFLLCGLFLLVFTLVPFIVQPVNLLAAEAWEKTVSQHASQDVHGLKKLSREEIDTFLDSLNDQQIRQALAQVLEQASARDAAPAENSDQTTRAGHHADIFYEAELGIGTVADRIYESLASIQTSSGKWAESFDRLSGSKGSGYLLVMVLLSAVIIACGLIVERLFMRFTEGFRQQLLANVALGRLQRFGRFISRLMLDATGVGLYMLTTFFMFVLMFDPGQAGHGVVSKILIISYYFRVIILAAKMVMSPFSSALRLLPLQDADARFLYCWFFRITLILAFFAAPGLIFRDAGSSKEIFMQIYGAAGVSLTILLMVMIWQSRQRVADAIYAGQAADTAPNFSLRVKFARTWHYCAFIYVISIGAFWTLNVLITGQGEIIKLMASLFLIPIFIGLDQWVQRLLKVASGEWPETIDLSEEDRPTEAGDQQSQSTMDIKHYVPLIRRTFRVVLVAFLFFLMLRLWGIDLSIGRFFTSHALNIIVTLILGFFIWEFTKARIDRKLKEEMPDQDEDAEEGGAGGSRSVTLLLLLRRFMLAIMFVIVALTILSSIGVNIGPLIAGAGVIGLAIGFGAQTLVRDIISGIFFLIDDAFRVGDYVQAGSAKGMVEHISLRSMRLRHPRGMVYTLPFGDVKLLTNFSRDYIITKLDIRVRYDADLKKIRKIVKTINNELKDKEEIARVMLSDLKSQGVREMDDSAMIVRVKFKTIPGEQFVIRREVYRMIQEKFRASGIEFAHRNVTVYLPPEVTEAADGDNLGEDTARGGRPDKKLIEAGAAAAITASQAEKSEKKPGK
jgi:small-conductance mechanosensitive channel